MSKTPLDLVAEAKARISTCTCLEAAARLAKNSGTLLIDVREPGEHAAGAIPHSLNVPRGVLEFKIGEVCSDTDAPVLVHCAGGGRAALAVDALRKLGYANATAIDGGFADLLESVKG